MWLPLNSGGCHLSEFCEAPMEEVELHILLGSRKSGRMDELEDIFRERSAVLTLLALMLWKSASTVVSEPSSDALIVDLVDFEAEVITRLVWLVI